MKRNKIKILILNYKGVLRMGVFIFFGVSILICIIIYLLSGGNDNNRGFGLNKPR